MKKFKLKDAYNEGITLRLQGKSKIFKKDELYSDDLYVQCYSDYFIIAGEINDTHLSDKTLVFNKLSISKNSAIQSFIKDESETILKRNESLNKDVPEVEEIEQLFKYDKATIEIE